MPARACIAAGWPATSPISAALALCDLDDKADAFCAALATPANAFGIGGQRGEGLGIGHQRGHHLRLAGQRLEARARGERAEVGIMDHQFERVGLHELRNRRVAERHVAFGDLADT